MVVARKKSDLRSRIGAALVLAPLALGAVYLGGPVLDIVLAASALIVLLEWRRMVGVQSNEKRLWIAVATILAGGGALLFTGPFSAIAIVAFGAAVVAAIAWAEGTRPWLGIGVVYAGVMMISLSALRGEGDLGAWALAWLFFTVWAADTFAYFTGRQLGGPKLWPAVSPNKTWSGALGGLVGAMLMAAAFLVVMPVESSLWLIPFGVLIAAVSMAGDLFESSIKRRFKVKDASRLIPGHGGLMDRADSIVAAGLLAALIGWWRMPDNIAMGLLAW